VPFDPRQVRYGEFGAALIAAAGPFTNLALAIVGALLLHVVHIDALQTILVTFTVLNVGLFVFNMIPIPPLDGSRILYAVAPEGVQAFMAQLEQLGFFIIFGLILVVPGFTTLILNIDQAIINFLF
jgi:Zn-dependent protease